MIFSNVVLSLFCLWFYYLSVLRNENLPVYSEPHFQSIVHKFKYEADIRNVKVDFTNQTISFDNLTGSVAQCYYGMRTLKVIRVDKTIWKKMTAEEKEATLFHEFGHCVLNRVAHDDLLKSDGCPVSLMHKSHSLKNCYFKNRSAYLDELFHQKGNE